MFIINLISFCVFWWFFELFYSVSNLLLFPPFPSSVLLLHIVCCCCAMTLTLLVTLSWLTFSSGPSSPITLVVAKCWDPNPKGYFTIPRQEPVRPIDPSAWIAHTEAVRGYPPGAGGGGGGGGMGHLPGGQVAGRGPLSGSISTMTSTTSSLTSSLPDTDRKSIKFSTFAYHFQYLSITKLFNK